MADKNPKSPDALGGDNIRLLKAHWFWLLVNCDEDVTIGMLKKNYSLVLLPIDYGKFVVPCY